VVSRRVDVSGVSGWTALAERVLVSRLRQRWLLADGRAGLWMCAECGLKTSATAGTIFHRSHTPLSTWVRRDLVRHLTEERGVGAGFAGRLGVRFV
jgi:hypothetical protein